MEIYYSVIQNQKFSYAVPTKLIHLCVGKLVMIWFEWDSFEKKTHFLNSNTPPIKMIIILELSIIKLLYHDTRRMHQYATSPYFWYQFF